MGYHVTHGAAGRQCHPDVAGVEQWYQSVLEELTPLVYRELRRLADTYMRRERPDHTLQPTALIHEAYLRLVDQKQPQWESRSQFFRFAAHLMRQILVDHARARKAKKRPGGEKVPPEQVEVIVGERPTDLIVLDAALIQLEEFDQRKAHIIELKFFGGMTEDEVAEALGISVRTLARDLRLAKAWLAQVMTLPSNGRSVRPIPPE
jgi:RNA polymerase sigma factor (TIGR02999 family)